MKLHIGGREKHPDWKILDVEPRPEVDFVADATNLSQFPSNSCDAIYASHVLEHFHHGISGEVLNVLKEWYRVLKPGGIIYLSVPDLDKLCWLYTRPGISFEEKLRIMAILYGTQTNIYDVHKVGFDYQILYYYLSMAGFINIQQVERFNIFNDCSNFCIRGELISLNVVATKKQGWSIEYV
ncbi:MAG: methyltransferase domain-containing protein [Pseudanabaenaceae cyanobacterium SKYGB_i_bin29]|nr:methyltransferase domain-containing protein [Pseudanabaenaceae cyanobacterium SKYG29]MDW8421060.1 methyltransferase domain-containing protein [Pseudanabaenaceae cyanobacterium SKYGB_i_bin29]